jgi:hypothetical protein
MKPITSAKYDLAPGFLRVIDETDKKTMRQFLTAA